MNHSPASALHYLWIDLELTGLQTTEDDIVEIGVIGTTKDLTPLFSTKIVVRPTAHGLSRIHDNPAVLKMHQANGLLDVLEGEGASRHLPRIDQAEQFIIQQIESFDSAADGRLLLAGSGVFHCDFRFLSRHTPELAALLDNREVLDVGVLRRAYEAATGRSLTPANSNKTHRADVDIQCSLEEGQRYFALFQETASRSTELVGANS